MACRSCKRCMASGCSKRRIPLPKMRRDGFSQRYWVKRNRWIRKNFPDQDWDNDKVKNKLDCEPEDPRYQDIISKNILDSKKDVEKSLLGQEEHKTNIYHELAAKWRQNRNLPKGSPIPYDVNEKINAKAEEISVERTGDYISREKLRAKERVDSTVSSLSSEELERELAEIGETPEEFDEFGARRKLREHWEDKIDSW